MASVVDSEAHFEQRLQELGLSDAVMSSLKTGGIKCLSRLAFSLGQPNQPIANDEVATFLRGLTGRDPTIQENSAIKRLAFEAQTYVVAVLRQGLEQREEGAPRKVSHAERTTRMAALQASLSGVFITGELDPAHVLLDKATAMFDQNVVKYLEPAACISRPLKFKDERRPKSSVLRRVPWC